MLCGALAGLPMKVVSMLACRELLHPTFGKRAAMSDGFQSDDDEDAIWLHGRHEEMELQ